MCNTYKEACFSQKIFTNGLNMVWSLWAWVEKQVHGVETHWLSGKEKFLDAVVSKEDHADNVLEHERVNHYWFSWKYVTVNG